MKINSRFSVAVHIVAVLGMTDKSVVTSEYLAASVNTNPVVIRRILGMLKEAGFVQIKRGTGGAALACKPDNISLLDIYRAVSGVEENGLFSIHEHPNVQCPVGANIQAVLNATMLEAQRAMEEELKRVTLADVTGSLSDRINHV